MVVKDALHREARGGGAKVGVGEEGRPRVPQLLARRRLAIAVHYVAVVHEELRREPEHDTPPALRLELIGARAVRQQREFRGITQPWRLQSADRRPRVSNRLLTEEERHERDGGDGDGDDGGRGEGVQPDARAVRGDQLRVDGRRRRLLLVHVSKANLPIYWCTSPVNNSVNRPPLPVQAACLE
eukprot:660806-Prymnesium_polylepis.2